MRVLITGASGQLGPYLMREAASLGVVFGWARRAAKGVHCLDLLDERSVKSSFAEVAADVVIHAAAISKPVTVLRDADLAQRVNVDATGLLAALSRSHGSRFVYLSTDMVFDGTAPPYSKTAEPCPANAYGRSKLMGERATLEAVGNCLVLRLSLMVGPSLNPARPTFFDEQVAAFRNGRSVTLFHDEWRTPMSYEGAAHAILTAARADATGVTHLGGPERLSRVEIGLRIAKALKATTEQIDACSRCAFDSAEPRPADLSLDSRDFDRSIGTDPKVRALDAAEGCALYDKIRSDPTF